VLKIIYILYLILYIIFNIIKLRFFYSTEHIKLFCIKIERQKFIGLNSPKRFTHLLLFQSEMFAISAALSQFAAVYSKSREESRCIIYIKVYG